MKFEVSTDGVNFSEAGNLKNDIAATETALIIKDFTVSLNPLPVRYIRVTAFTLEACPKGHPGEGSPAWTFADEIIVE